MLNFVKELLENNTISNEVAEALDKSVMGMVTPLRDEAKGLRLEKETLSKNFDEVVKSKGDLDKQLLGLDEQIAQAKRDGQSELTTQLEAERASKSELQKSLDNLQTANTNLRLDTAVTQGLDKFDVKKEDREIVSHFLRSKTSMTDDGIKFKNERGSFGIDEAFKEYFEANGSRLNVVGGNGNGSGAGGGGGGSTPNFGGNEAERKSAMQSIIDKG